MNLVDVDVTTPRRAFDEVSRLAAERGMSVLSSEIVGLVPEAALRPGDAQHVRLRDFDPTAQVLERLVDDAAPADPVDGAGTVDGAEVNGAR
jgi:glutamate formiminotransferase